MYSNKIIHSYSGFSSDYINLLPFTNKIIQQTSKKAKVESWFCIRTLSLGQILGLWTPLLVGDTGHLCWLHFS